MQDQMCRHEVLYDQLAEIMKDQLQGCQGIAAKVLELKRQNQEMRNMMCTVVLDKVDVEMELVGIKADLMTTMQQINLGVEAASRKIISTHTMVLRLREEIDEWNRYYDYWNRWYASRR